MKQDLPGVVARSARALRRRFDRWVPCACPECPCRHAVQTRDICSSCVEGEHRP